MVAAMVSILFALAPVGAVSAQDDDGGSSDVTTVTVNDFVPTERDLSECISAVPKPGCGSEARGGWRQTAVFALVVAGLGFIAWRVVAGARRNLAPQPATRDAAAPPVPASPGDATAATHENPQNDTPSDTQ